LAGIISLGQGSLDGWWGFAEPSARPCRLQSVVDQLLAGLRALAERRQTQPEDLTLHADTHMRR